jgi:hypothetical protein
VTKSSQRTAQRAEDQWWDWALDETAGGAPTPDLADRVRGAIAAPRPVPHGAAVRRHWFAAACVLLGVGALAGVAWFGRASSTAQPAQQPAPQQPAPQQPTPHQPPPQQPAPPHAAPQQPVPNRPAPGAPVPTAPLPTGRPGGNMPHLTRPSALEPEQSRPEPGWMLATTGDELAKVPDDCRALQLAHADAERIASLTRLRNLERLDLSALPGLMPDPVPLSEDALRAVATLTTLHELRLRLRSELQPRWLAHVAALPQLETLLLDYVPIDDAGAAELAKLPSLRRLDLGFSPALTDQGVREIASMAGLRSLSLRGCGQLTAKGLAELGRLQQLEMLDLGSVAGLAAGPGGGFAATTIPVGGALGGGRPLPAGRPQLAVPLRKNPNSDAGVGDETLAALAGCAKLRDLRLGGCPMVTPAGLEKLSRLPLRALDLYVLGSFGPFLRVLPPTLESLRLAYCRAVTDADLQELGKQLPMLRKLDLSHCTSITDAGLAALFASLPLRELHLRGCSGLTAKSAETLHAATSLEELEVDGDWVDDAVRAQLPAMPRLDKAKAGVKAVLDVATLYRLNKSGWPTTLDDLTTPDARGLKYLAQSVDPWGNAYVLRVAADGRTFEVRSAGPDGKLDTDDDVVASSRR